MTEIKQKYIIKNCSAKPSDIKAAYGWCSTYQIKCQDCADCLIKQIIEKCKDAQSECSCEDPIKDIDCFECTSGGRAELGTEILQLFDIEVLKDSKDENTNTL